MAQLFIQSPSQITENQIDQVNKCIYFIYIYTHTHTHTYNTFVNIYIKTLFFKDKLSDSKDLNCYKIFVFCLNVVLCNFLFKESRKKYHRLQKILSSTTVSNFDNELAF